MGEGKFTEHLLIHLGQVVKEVKYCFLSGAFIRKEYSFLT